jgi:hypothetical protein
VEEESEGEGKSTNVAGRGDDGDGYHNHGYHNHGHAPSSWHCSGVGAERGVAIGVEKEFKLIINYD